MRHDLDTGGSSPRNLLRTCPPFQKPGAAKQQHLQLLHENFTFRIINFLNPLVVVEILFPTYFRWSRPGNLACLNQSRLHALACR